MQYCRLVLCGTFYPVGERSPLARVAALTVEASRRSPVEPLPPTFCLLL